MSDYWIFYDEYESARRSVFIARVTHLPTNATLPFEFDSIPEARDFIRRLRLAHKYRGK